MTTPDGQVIVWLARGDGSGQVEAVLHAPLDNGWNIERLSAESVVLVQVQTQERTTIALPAPPAENN
jgi:hypothetical protein